MSINLTRDPSNGRIRTNNNRNIILRGGHYWIFKDDDMPGRCLVKPGEPLPFRVEYNKTTPPPPIAGYKPPCQEDDSFAVEERMWDPEPWDMLLNHMEMFSCNFLRLWLTGGTQVSGSGKEAKPLDLTPFNRVKVDNKWKWQVYKAVFTANDAGWNAEYFRRLNSFAEKAEARGIVLQITLFNYLDISSRFDGCGFRAWSRSPYNPDLSDHPAGLPNWAKNHLVNPPLEPTDDAAVIERKRQEFFLVPGNNLRKVQLALITKVVKTLSERTNIIYEIMNEPRGINDQITKFNSDMVTAILSAAGGKRPLISVNASNMGNDGSCDVDSWRNSPNQTLKDSYKELDAISYHGLSGYPFSSPLNCNGIKTSVSAVDRQSIDDRFTRHRNANIGHPSKSLIYCTDAARSGIHIYSSTTDFEQEVQVRDGQIFTFYPNDDTTDTLENRRRKSDLQNWAYWCFKHAVAPNAGMVHLQNHSMNQMSYRRIRDAYLQAGGTDVTANEPVEAAAA